MKAEVAKVQTFFLSLNFCNLSSIFVSSERKIVITTRPALVVTIIFHQKMALIFFKECHKNVHICMLEIGIDLWQEVQCIGDRN